MLSEANLKKLKNGSMEEKENSHKLTITEKNEKHQTMKTILKIKKTKCNGVRPFEFYFNERKSQGMRSFAYVKNELLSMRSFAKANSQNQSKRKLLSYEATEEDDGDLMVTSRLQSADTSLYTDCTYLYVPIDRKHNL